MHLPQPQPAPKPIGIRFIEALRIFKKFFRSIWYSFFSQKDFTELTSEHKSYIARKIADSKVLHFNTGSDYVEFDTKTGRTYRMEIVQTKKEVYRHGRFLKKRIKQFVISLKYSNGTSRIKDGLDAESVKWYLYFRGFDVGI